MVSEYWDNSLKSEQDTFVYFSPPSLSFKRSGSCQEGTKEKKKHSYFAMSMVETLDACREKTLTVIKRLLLFII